MYSTLQKNICQTNLKRQNVLISLASLPYVYNVDYLSQNLDIGSYEDSSNNFHIKEKRQVYKYFVVDSQLY